MRKAFLGLALSALTFNASASSYGSTIAVIDSGIDRQHYQLQDGMWMNPIDTDFDGEDNDWNGYVDDVYGWNFFAQNPVIIDYKFIKLYRPDVLRFFDIQAAALNGTASDDDLQWAKEMVGNPQFTKDLMTFGNFVHGTHVAAIARQPSPDAKILAIKLMPTENPLASIEDKIRKAASEEENPNKIVEQIIKAGLFVLAKVQASMFVKIGEYVDEHKVDVVNGSFGVGPLQANMIVSTLLRLGNGGKEPTQDAIDAMAGFFLKRVNIEQRAMLEKAPNTLFVFAAGNDNSNNDLLPTAPASIDHPNRISVAAVYDDGKLAPFSNFGTSVDIAAPGVAIKSAIPDDRILELSGTSQASPLVAGAAAAVKDRNSKLTPPMIKKILVETVDVRAELQGKVNSSGILNLERALYAAELTRELAIEEAIEQAKASVADNQRQRTAIVPTQNEVPYFSIMPSFL